MHARVVRFTDVSRDRVDQIIARVEDEGGPPEGVRSTGMQLLYDADQSTAIFVGFFASEEDLREADAVFENMEPGETPGTRASVDRAEVVLQREA